MFLFSFYHFAGNDKKNSCKSPDQSPFPGPCEESKVLVMGPQFNDTHSHQDSNSSQTGGCEGTPSLRMVCACVCVHVCVYVSSLEMCPCMTVYWELGWCPSLCLNYQEKACMVTLAKFPVCPTFFPTFGQRAREGFSHWEWYVWVFLYGREHVRCTLFIVSLQYMWKRWLLCMFSIGCHYPDS